MDDRLQGAGRQGSRFTVWGSGFRVWGRLNLELGG